MKLIGSSSKTVLHENGLKLLRILWIHLYLIKFKYYLLGNYIVVCFKEKKGNILYCFL